MAFCEVEAGLRQIALDKASDVCLSYTDIDLGIRSRAIGLLAGSCALTSRLTRRWNRPQTYYHGKRHRR